MQFNKTWEAVRQLVTAFVQCRSHKQLRSNTVKITGSVVSEYVNGLGPRGAFNMLTMTLTSPLRSIMAAET